MIWAELVDGKQLYMVPFVPDRGAIYDRNGVLMAGTTDAVAIGVIPDQIAEDDDSVANALSRLIGNSAADIKALYQNAIQDQYVAIGEVERRRAGQDELCPKPAGRADQPLHRPLLRRQRGRRRTSPAIPSSSRPTS